MEAAINQECSDRALGRRKQNQHKLQDFTVFFTTRVQGVSTELWQKIDPTSSLSHRKQLFGDAASLSLNQ